MKKGFTFIELILIILLIGVMMGISLPRFRSSFNNLQLNNFAGQLQSYVNFLRDRSIVNSCVVVLRIDKTTKTYWGEILKNKPDEKEILKSYGIPADIKVSISRVNPPSDTSSFQVYPDGQIEKVDITIFHSLSEQQIVLTSQGVFSGLKIKAKE